MPAAYLNSFFKNGFPGNDPDISDVASAARRLKISQQATALRLEELKVFKPGSYEKWLKAIHNVGNPDFSEKGGGAGGPPPQEKVKLAKYGFKFATAFAPLLQDGKISEINLFRSSGLKPKYQRSYFDFVGSLTPSGLQGLELD